jgi:hypothetical protein
MTLRKMVLAAAAAVLAAGCNTTSQQTGSYQASAVQQASPEQLAQSDEPQRTPGHPTGTPGRAKHVSEQAPGELLGQQPQTVLGSLDTADSNYASPGCREVRERASAYNDRIGERVAAGVGIGLTVGLIGLPVAIAVDANQAAQRRALNREIVVRCVAGGEAIVAADDAARQQREREFQDRTSQAVQ